MRLARASLQMPLLEVEPRYKVFNSASARTAYGAAAQEIVCAALQLDPIAINGNCDICFDAEKHGTFYEIKSVRSGQKVVIYNWRMQKEEKFSDVLFYAILLHTVSRQRDEIISRMVAGAEILLLPARVVHEAAKACPTHIPTINPEHASARHGYTRKGYADGYRNVSVTKLKGEAARAGSVDICLYGHRANIPIYL